MFSYVLQLQTFELQLQNATNAFYQNINVTVAKYIIFLKLPSVFYLFIKNPTLPFILKTKHASGWPCISHVPLCCCSYREERVRLCDKKGFPFISLQSVNKLRDFLYAIAIFHSFQNRTEPGGRTVKIGNRDENRFFKPK